MKLDDSVKMLGAQFVLEKLHFRLDRSSPELPIQVTSPAGIARVVLKAGGIANGVRVEQEAFRHFAVDCEVLKELGDRQRARGFVTMNCGKKSDSNWVAAIFPLESEAWQ